MTAADVPGRDAGIVGADAVEAAARAMVREGFRQLGHLDVSEATVTHDLENGLAQDGDDIRAEARAGLTAALPLLAASWKARVEALADEAEAETNDVMAGRMHGGAPFPASVRTDRLRALLADLPGDAGVPDEAAIRADERERVAKAIEADLDEDFRAREWGRRAARVVRTPADGEAGRA